MIIVLCWILQLVGLMLSCFRKCLSGFQCRYPIHYLFEVHLWTLQLLEIIEWSVFFVVTLCFVGAFVFLWDYLFVGFYWQSYFIWSNLHYWFSNLKKKNCHATLENYRCVCPCIQHSCLDNCDNMDLCMFAHLLSFISPADSFPFQVHAAYKRALFKFHPDRASRTDIYEQVEAEEKFKLISRMKEKFMLPSWQDVLTIYSKFWWKNL